MKCVCGYEGRDYKAYDLRVIDTWPDKNGDIRENDNGTLEVFICPKCGTLRVEVKK